MTGPSGAIAWAWYLLTNDASVAALITEQLPESRTRIGVYEDGFVPQTVNVNNADYIVLRAQSYREVGSSIDGTRGAANMLLCVKAISKAAGYARSEAIMAAADGVLQKASGAINGVNVLSCIAQNSVRYPEYRDSDGATFAHYGIMYRLFVSEDQN